MANLTRTRGIILKIRSRDRSGRLIHKSEFSTDDSKAVGNELKIWRDKFGIPLKTFKVVTQSPIDQEELNNVKKLMQDQIKEEQEKTKKALASKPLN